MQQWFLADAVRWCVLQPEQRAAIGTADGHARLTVEFGVRVASFAVPETP